jgi:hypothetical protein
MFSGKLAKGMPEDILKSFLLLRKEVLTKLGLQT